LSSGEALPVGFPHLQGNSGPASIGYARGAEYVGKLLNRGGLRAGQEPYALYAK